MIYKHCILEAYEVELQVRFSPLFSPLRGPLRGQGHFQYAKGTSIGKLMLQYVGKTFEGGTKAKNKATAACSPWPICISRPRNQGLELVFNR